MLCFSGGDCDTAIYSTDLFMGVGFWFSVLIDFLSLSHIGHVAGWERSGTWACGCFNWSCFTISLSQPYALYGRGSAGRRASWLSSSQSHMNNFVHRALCFGVGCLWRARIVLFTRFIWNFSFWRIDNNVFVYWENYLLKRMLEHSFSS